MKKFIYSFIFIILFMPSVVFAYSCTNLESEIDSTISKLDKDRHEIIIKIAIFLKNEGIKAHESGNHDLSEELLNGTLRLLDI